MDKNTTPELITKSARSLAAKKMWEKRRMKEVENTQIKKVDWHLLCSAIGIVITLGSIIFGCYFSLKGDVGDVSKEIIKIETALILKGVAPAELFAREER